jgi:hypothetical protein
LPWAGPISFSFFLIFPSQPTGHFPVPGPSTLTSLPCPRAARPGAATLGTCRWSDPPSHASLCRVAATHHLAPFNSGPPLLLPPRGAARTEPPPSPPLFSLSVVRPRKAADIPVIPFSREHLTEDPNPPCLPTGSLSRFSVAETLPPRRISSKPRRRPPPPMRATPSPSTLDWSRPSSPLFFLETQGTSEPTLFLRASPPPRTAAAPDLLCHLHVAPLSR